tara:strand:+ start:5434 stop:5763 length:330 start_codon:yes stop_codon:yes gene_type:complete
MKSTSAVSLNLKEVRRRCFWVAQWGGEFFNRVERTARRLYTVQRLTFWMNRNPDPVTSGTEAKNTRSVITMGLLKAIVGGTIGLAVGVATCQPISGMVGGAFVAQDWGK